MSARACAAYRAAEPALLDRLRAREAARGAGRRLELGGGGKRGGASWQRRHRREAATALFSSYGAASAGSCMPPATVKVYEAAPAKPPAADKQQQQQQAQQSAAAQSSSSTSTRRVVAEVVVRAPVETVWRVLTDYDRLAEFVPNLERCERVPCPRPGRVWLLQRGCSQGALWRLQAEAVLEVEEVALALGRREARFSMVEGDFREVSGRWVVEPDPSSAGGRATLLRYDISVQPRLSLPSTIVSYVVRQGLPANIRAVAQRAEELAARQLRASGLASWAGVEEDPPLPAITAGASTSSSSSSSDEEGALPAAAAAAASSRAVLEDGLPCKGPFWPQGSSYAAAAPLTAAQQRRRAEEDAARSLYLGVTSVPVPPAGKLGGLMGGNPGLQQELDERQRQKELLQAAYPAFGLQRAGGGGAADSSDESGGEAEPTPAPPAAAAGASTPPPDSGYVASALSAAAAAGLAQVHLRRLDGLDYLHRRAVGAITVHAPPHLVWSVLTDYNRLADFVPNLAVSERIALPPGAPSTVVRVRQVGYKRMLYVALHAECVLDLVERAPSEIQFRQVEGDFERFQGKWMVTALPGTAVSPETGLDRPQTQLKYAVEIVIPRTTRMLGVIEPVMERVVFEDVPANLAAIKRRVESLHLEAELAQLESEGEGSAAALLRRRLERPPLAGMVDDFAVLAAELERCFGAERALPGRNELRDMNRSDLEKAMRAHGGPAAVARQLGWRLKTAGRRPKGYWDSLPNVRAELEAFLEDAGLPPGVMPPKNDFVRAGRYDLARCVERWGGLYQLAGELGYEVSATSARGATEWQSHISEVAASTGLSGREGLFELAARTYAERRSLTSSADEEEGEVAGGRGGGRARQRRRGGVDRMPSLREEIDAW